MPFINIPGVTGKVYVPDEKQGRIKKHNCSDCFLCQICSDDRCLLCKGKKSCGASCSIEKENGLKTSE